jgi:hypothetical protein
MSHDLTVEQFSRVLPKQMRGSASQSLVDHVNSLVADPVMREQYRDNLLGFTSVMKNGKFKMESYVDAVRYVSFKLTGATNILAYTRTFPDRYQSFLDNGTSDKDIASYITSYNKNKLVNLIMEQTLIPSYVYNAELYQRALNVQAELMVSANSEKVRTDAANSILTQLKQPEIKKIELDIGVKDDDVIKELRETTLELVAQQKKMILAGASSAQDVAHSSILIEGEVVDE